VLAPIDPSALVSGQGGGSKSSKKKSSKDSSKVNSKDCSKDSSKDAAKEKARKTIIGSAAGGGKSEKSPAASAANIAIGVNNIKSMIVKAASTKEPGT